MVSRGCEVDQVRKDENSYLGMKWGEQKDVEDKDKLFQRKREGKINRVIVLRWVGGEVCECESVDRRFNSLFACHFGEKSIC